MVAWSRPSLIDNNRFARPLSSYRIFIVDGKDLCRQTCAHTFLPPKIYPSKIDTDISLNIRIYFLSTSSKQYRHRFVAIYLLILYFNLPYTLATQILTALLIDYHPWLLRYSAAYIRAPAIIIRMNRRARVQWPQYTDEDWKNLGYCDRPPKYPDLTCNVHPIFAKFLDNGIRRFDGTDEEYEKILPALQLATNYLYSPSARKYIYSIVYGDRRTVSVEGFGSVEEFDEIDPSLYSSERMDRIWNQTADHHRFGPCSFQIGSVLAATYDIRGDGPDLKGTGCHGRATIIAFNPGWIVDINRLHASGRAQSMEMICIQFHLAMTFCHEVAHAVGLANQPKPFEAGLALPEPFFKDEVGAELGFSFVNEILGGTLNGWNFGHRGNILTINDCK